MVEPFLVSTARARWDQDDRFIVVGKCYLQVACDDYGSLSAWGVDSELGDVGGEMGPEVRTARAMSAVRGLQKGR